MKNANIGLEFLDGRLPTLEILLSLCVSFDHGGGHPTDVYFLEWTPISASRHPTTLHLGAKTKIIIMPPYHIAQVII